MALLILKAVVRIARARELPERLPLTAGIVGCAVAMMGVPVSPPFSWMLLLAGMGTIPSEPLTRTRPEEESAGEPPALVPWIEPASVRSS